MTDKRSHGRKNPSVLTSQTEEDLDQVWRINSHNVDLLCNQDEDIPFDDCWIWKGSKQNGYPCISRGHAKSKLKMHMLAAWHKYKQHPTPGQVVSHLCHRKCCINPDHLVIESISTNNSRVGCLATFNSNLVGYTWRMCPHSTKSSPYCLRRDTDNLPKNWSPGLHIPVPKHF